MFNTIIKEWKELFADKRIWIGIFMVLIIIIIGTSYNRKKEEVPISEKLRLGVINHDNSSYSELLLTYFNGSETFSSLISVIIGENDEIKEAFQKGELDIFLEIPQGFAENMIRIEHLPIEVTINIQDTTKAILFKNVLESYEKYISAVEMNAVGLYDIMEKDGINPDIIEHANTTVSMDLIFTALGKEAFFSFKTVDTFPATTLSEYYLISVLVMFLLYSGLYGGFQLINEITMGTFARMKTTRLPMYQFLTAKILLLTITLTAIAVLSICFIRNSSYSLAIGLTGFAMSLFSVTFAILLSAFFDTTQRYILVGNLVIFYCIVIGGGIIPIQFLPQDILQLAKMTPNYHMVEGIIRLGQGQLSHTYLIIAVLFLIAALNFTLTLLFYSKRRVAYEKA
ncbi:ABC transporter permease [Mobilitalea sibirica]|uniref:ABC transporter permease n=1 Tax=Mobilitalea sibirica TaxID=1462919 RepID=A0A8J7KVY1_9FIRM|nr:ABC transporter permease [Mobilitalea sibirica]MBH1939687.1 ABC transporter permease [Mobilitalea sibirica]